MKKTKGKIIAADIAECAIFVAVMSAAAYVTIPFPLVPLTFQTVIAVLSGLLLGWKKGLISMSVYCFTGLIGVPVFTAGGGIFYVLKLSFGYILGFILSAAVAGLITGRKDLPLWRYVVGALAAFVADYAIGIPYCIISARLLNLDNLVNLFVTGNLIYMPKDAVLSILAGLLAFKVLPVIDKGRARLNAEKSK